MKARTDSLTFRLSSAFKTPVLALGGQQKSRFCLGRGKDAFLSRDFGDLNLADNFSAYRKELAKICRELRFRPGLIARDLHPDYTLTCWADRFRSRKFPRAEIIAVQHHHAHIASVLAAAGNRGPVIGIVWDGTGYGDDGALWGGEFLIADTRSCRRLAHLEYVPLPGGEKAIEEPWRMALSYLYHFGGKDFLDPDLPLFKDLPGDRARFILAMIDKEINSPSTSSVGRLFDAVSALLGLGDTSEFPAQAAIRLEKAVDALPLRTYPFSLRSGKKPYIISFKRMFSEIIDDLRRRVPAGVIAAGFHAALVEMGAKVASRIARETGLKKVVLSGGVFQNEIIFRDLNARLKSAGLEPIFNRRLPLHDGGIALGQAVVAADQIE